MSDTQMHNLGYHMMVKKVYRKFTICIIEAKLVQVKHLKIVVARAKLKATKEKSSLASPLWMN